MLLKMRPNTLRLSGCGVLESEQYAPEVHIGALINGVCSSQYCCMIDGSINGQSHKHTKLVTGDRCVSIRPRTSCLGIQKASLGKSWKGFLLFLLLFISTLFLYFVFVLVLLLLLSYYCLFLLVSFFFSASIVFFLLFLW